MLAPPVSAQFGTPEDAEFVLVNTRLEICDRVDTPIAIATRL
jgi:hypothetical protein